MYTSLNNNRGHAVVVLFYLFAAAWVLFNVASCLFPEGVKLKSYTEYPVDEVHYVYKRRPYYSFSYVDENKILHTKYLTHLRDGYLNFCPEDAWEDGFYVPSEIRSQFRFFDLGNPYRQVVIKDLARGERGYARVIEFSDLIRGVNKCRSFYAEIHIPVNGSVKEAPARVYGRR